MWAETFQNALLPLTTRNVPDSVYSISLTPWVMIIYNMNRK
jgi:hypothetical protein